jgi:recombination protein RecA
MVKRERILLERVRGGGSYFAAPKTDLNFIPTGSKMLDLALGGGWVENRIANIVGDKATGKSLLCIEACANFVAKHSKGEIKYMECEAAFDPKYAEALGMPLDRVDFGEQFNTVEDMFEHLTIVVQKAKHPTLYIIDSLDSLSDKAEMDRDLDEGTYGTGKAKMMSQIFRRVVRDMQRSKVTLIIVSQVRDNIGVTFGRKTTRSGGRALDFYSSQTIFLAQLGQETKTIKGVMRPIGVKLRAKVDKNKVSLPYRQADFGISFGYGIDDVPSCLDWLKEVKALDLIGLKQDGIKDYIKTLDKMDDRAYQMEVSKIHREVTDRWYEIEASFMPKRRKYRG